MDRWLCGPCKPEETGCQAGTGHAGEWETMEFGAGCPAFSLFLRLLVECIPVQGEETGRGGADAHWMKLGSCSKFFGMTVKDILGMYVSEVMATLKL